MWSLNFEYREISWFEISSQANSSTVIETIVIILFGFLLSELNQHEVDHKTLPKS